MLGSQKVTKPEPPGWPSSATKRGRYAAVASLIGGLMHLPTLAEYLFEARSVSVQNSRILRRSPFRKAFANVFPHPVRV